MDYTAATSSWLRKTPTQLQKDFESYPVDSKHRRTGPWKPVEQHAVRVAAPVVTCSWVGMEKINLEKKASMVNKAINSISKNRALF
jgi:hypothetical protein